MPRSRGCQPRPLALSAPDEISGLAADDPAGFRLGEGRLRGRDDARHDHGGAIEAVRNARRDLVLPVVAFVYRLVLRLALGFALEAAQPDIDGSVGLTPEAAADDHPLRDLEGDDLLLHDLDPLVHLAGQDLVLAEVVKGHVRRLLDTKAPPC